MALKRKRYVDLYLLPMPKKNLKAYTKLATAAGKIFRKHGVQIYLETVADDLTQYGGMADFKRVFKLKKGETLVYATCEFKSKAHRNKVMKKLFSDPELQATNPNPKKPLFDMKRMLYGGFKPIVDL